MDFALKMMDFVLNMMNCDGLCSKYDELCAAFVVSDVIYQALQETAKLKGQSFDCTVRTRAREAQRCGEDPGRASPAFEPPSDRRPRRPAAAPAQRRRHEGPEGAARPGGEASARGSVQCQCDTARDQS